VGYTFQKKKGHGGGTKWKAGVKRCFHKGNGGDFHNKKNTWVEMGLECQKKTETKVGRKQYKRGPLVGEPGNKSFHKGMGGQISSEGIN